MAKSVALDRKINAYPSPVNHKLLVAESELNGVSRSSIVDKALKLYYEGMPEVDRRKLLNELK